MLRSLFALLGVVLLVGCPGASPISDAGMLLDAGQRSDAATDVGPVVDSGLVVDSGPLPDAGWDAGPRPDLGEWVNTSDSGFSLRWEASLPNGAFSSPRVYPATSRLNPGRSEIVIGFGREGLFGGAIALDTEVGQQMWRAAATQEVVSSSLAVDLNNDGYDDRVIGGRHSVLFAIDGRSGARLWEFSPKGTGARRFGLYNFYSVLALDDVSGDGIPDLLAVNGGDSMAAPGAARPAAHLMILNGADGSELQRIPTPDQFESYTSPVFFDRGAAGRWVLFGTGGETLQGSLWAVPLDDLIGGSMDGALSVFGPIMDKGVIAPPTMVDLTGDGQDDIVLPFFDGRVAAIDGSNFESIWDFSFALSESQNSAAIGYFNDDEVPDVAVSANRGVFPMWNFGTVAVLDGRDGSVLMEQNLDDDILTMSSAAAVDYDGDGMDEVIVTFSDPRNLQDLGEQAFLVAIHVDEQRIETLARFDGMAVATPWVGDADGDGKLEIFAASYRAFRGTMFRFNSIFDAPEKVSWGAYFGSDYSSRFEPR
jgi:outer membrane protein assembly factor BamB